MNLVRAELERSLPEVSVIEDRVWQQLDTVDDFQVNKYIKLAGYALQYASESLDIAHARLLELDLKA